MASIKETENELLDVSEVPEETIKFLQNFTGKHIFVYIDSSGKVSHRAGNIEDHIDELKHKNNKGCSIYFTVNESSNNRRRIIDMNRIRAVFLDDDIQRESHRDDFLLDPSIIIETSPGKFHYYWLTDTKDIKTWNSVIDTMIQVYKTDPSIKDVSRVLRLPGFVHPRTEFTTRIVYPINPAEEPKIYKWREILEAFPPSAVAKASGEGNYKNDSSFSPIVAITDFLTGKSIAPSMNSLIMHWTFKFSDEFVREEIDKLFQNIPQDIYSEHSLRYENARVQIDKFCKSARKKVNEIQIEQDDDENKDIYVVPRALNENVERLMNNPIPRDCLPTTLLEAADEIGRWTGVGPDPAIISAINITSAILGKNVIIHEIADSATTHCQCGVIIAMGTGTRKSQIYEKMNKPFFDFEEELIAAWEKKKNYNLEMVNTLIMTKNSMIKSFQKKKNPTPEEMIDHVKQKATVQDSIDGIQVTPPALYTADVTEERLIQKLKDNNGTLAVISDDARNTIKNIMGRYSNDSGTAEGVYINGLTGSTIKYHRVRDNTEVDIRRPCMNVLLFIQPDIAIKLMNSEMFVPSGMAARMPIYYYPVAGEDIIDKTERDLLDYRLMMPYYNALSALKIRRDKPLQVRLDDMGMEACRRFDKHLVDLLRTTWRDNYDKINKIVTQSLIYSVCIAALDDPIFAQMLKDSDGSKTDAYILPVKYINMGQMYAESLFEQTIMTHEDLNKTPLFDMAKVVKNWIEKQYKAGKIFEGFMNNGAFRNRHSVRIRPHMDEVLNLLVEYGWLRTYLWPRSGGVKELNNGFISGKAKPGSLVYKYNNKGANLFYEKLAASRLSEDDVIGSLA